MLASIGKPLKPLRFSTFFLSKLVPLNLAFQHINQLAEQKFKQPDKTGKTEDNFQNKIVVSNLFKTGLPRRYDLELPVFDEICRDYAERARIDINKPVITYILHSWDGLIVSRRFALQIYCINLQHRNTYANGGIDDTLREHFLTLKTKTSQAVIKINKAIMFLSFKLSELFWHFEQNYNNDDVRPLLKYRAREIRGTEGIDFEDIPTIDEIVDQLYLLDSDSLDLIASNISVAFLEPDKTLFGLINNDESDKPADISSITPAYILYINDTSLPRMLLYIEEIVKRGELKNAKPLNLEDFED